MSDIEKRLVKKKNMKKECVPFTEIVKITRRSSETVAKILYPTKGGPKQVKKGAPKKLPPRVLAKVVRSMRILQMQKHPKGKEVTKEIALAHARVKVSARTLQRELRARNIYFYKLKPRPLLTTDDIKARKVWTKLRKKRSRAGWVTKPHAVIDNKRFQIYGTAAGRAHAARRSIRGAYQAKGQMPEQHMV